MLVAVTVSARGRASMSQWECHWEVSVACGMVSTEEYRGISICRPPGPHRFHWYTSHHSCDSASRCCIRAAPRRRSLPGGMRVWGGYGASWGEREDGAVSHHNTPPLSLSLSRPVSSAPALPYLCPPPPDIRPAHHGAQLTPRAPGVTAYVRPPSSFPLPSFPPSLLPSFPPSLLLPWWLRWSGWCRGYRPRRCPTRSAGPSSGCERWPRPPR